MYVELEWFNGLEWETAWVTKYSEYHYYLMENYGAEEIGEI